MVYCRTLPDLTFPVTEWDLGTRLVPESSGFLSNKFDTRLAPGKLSYLQFVFIKDA